MCMNNFMIWLYYKYFVIFSNNLTRFDRKKILLKQINLKNDL
jgi:hypothetical protein